MTHRLNAWLLALVVLIGGPFYWLLLDNPARSAAPHPVSIAQLRSLAASAPGTRPAGVEMTVIGWRLVSGNVHAAGAGLKRKLLGITSFRLPVPGGRPVVIDTGTTADLARSIDLHGYLPHRQRFVDGNLRAAGVILAMSERPEHLGGLAALAARPDGAAALAQARLNPAQAPGAPAAAVPWPDRLAPPPAIGPGPVAVAPGVVVIPAPGPTPGAQMVYARLQDGREYLFAGDVAPFAVNFLELRVRSHLGNLRDAEDREATMRWLVTIDALRRQAPGLIVVPGHDSGWTSDPRNNTRVVTVTGPAAPAKPAGS